MVRGGARAACDFFRIDASVQHTSSDADFGRDGPRRNRCGRNRILNSYLQNTGSYLVGSVCVRN